MLLRGGGTAGTNPPGGVGGYAPQPVDDQPPPPLATTLSYVQVRVCPMCEVESVLCAVFSLYSVQSLVCVMCCL